MNGPAGRRAELAAALTAVRTRVAAACAAAGRGLDEVELLAVTKTHPAADVAALLDLGLSAFGENRPQEAGAKSAELRRLRPGADARWHLVGRLQRNKARSVATWAARVESIDSARLAGALDDAVSRIREAGGRDGALPVLVQISLDADPARGGVPLDGARALSDAVAGSRSLLLRGVMAVAPRGADPDRAFATLRRAATGIHAEHPGAEVISAGMTADLEAAIRNGSTCVRVGTALLGDRPLILR